MVSLCSSVLDNNTNNAGHFAGFIMDKSHKTDICTSEYHVTVPIVSYPASEIDLKNRNVSKRMHDTSKWAYNQHLKCWLAIKCDATVQNGTERQPFTVKSYSTILRIGGLSKHFFLIQHNDIFSNRTNFKTDCFKLTFCSCQNDADVSILHHFTTQFGSACSKAFFLFPSINPVTLAYSFT